jgi:hypothetical protein
MKHFASALVALTVLGGPVAAQTLTILLPAITFPTTVTTSTKGCESAQTTTPVCQLDE